MKLNLFHLVFLIFLVLKLAAIGPVALWSWWWICSPLLGLVGFHAIGSLLKDDRTDVEKAVDSIRKGK